MANIVPMHEGYEKIADASRRQVTEVELTEDERRKYMEARTALLWAARFFAVIFYEKAIMRFTRDIPTLATDDVVILANPDYFCKLSVGERVFALCHEVAHMIYAHCQLGWEAQQRGWLTVQSGATVLCEGYAAGALPFNAKLMNFAQDFMINAALIEAKCGTYNPSWLHNAKYTGTMSSVAIYLDLWNQLPPQAKQRVADAAKQAGEGSPGEGGAGDIDVPSSGGKQRFDEHLRPGSQQGKTPREAADARNGQTEEWKFTVTKAAQAARIAGQLPAGLERLVNDIVSPPVDWREHIVCSIARTLGGGGYDWKRADRDWINRQPNRIYVPARSGNGCGTIVIAGDTSGSITDDEMKMVMGCAVGVLEDARPQRIILLWCDTKVYYDGEYEDAQELLSRAKPKGGGGTDFRPVFDWCEENDVTPDTLIYVTDMYGRFSEREPSYPVLWCSISNVLDAPWGEVIPIPR